jgi:tyrosyl-DNA phosphodiesterase 2
MFKRPMSSVNGLAKLVLPNVLHGFTSKYSLGSPKEIKQASHKHLPSLKENNINVFKVMNYNIWFSEIHQIERLISLGENIKLHNPDIICFQEVTPMIYEKLINQLCEHTYYYPQKMENNYGCVIFSKHPIIDSTEVTYKNTSMNRNLLTATIELKVYNAKKDIIETKNIIIGTSHFESIFKKFNGIKIEQYDKAKKVLDEINNGQNFVILCADTNITNGEEKYFITSDNNWKDAWIVDGEDDNKKDTYDSYNNTNLMSRFTSKYTSRIDRIIYIENNLLVQEDFELIKGIDGLIEPSDHFGIMATFRLVES